MNRRDTLKKLATAGGGLLVLPAWARSWSVDELEAHPSSFSFQEKSLLASVADTIIPAGDTLGAISVGVDTFLQKLIANCYESDVQQNVEKQLKALDVSAQTEYQKSFTVCSQAERQTLLAKFGASADKSEADFFTLMKSETIRGFNTSREVMVNYLHYKLVPGHYYGCVDVKA